MLEHDTLSWFLSHCWSVSLYLFVSFSLYTSFLMTLALVVSAFQCLAAMSGLLFAVFSSCFQIRVHLPLIWTNGASWSLVASTF